MKHRNSPLVTVVIPAQNEADTIADVIRQAKKIHDSTEVIVVVNGSKDDTAEIVRKMNVEVYEFQRALGHDIGRAFGAYRARGRAILFVDGDFVIDASDMRAYVDAVLEDNVDLALNRYPLGINNQSFSTIVFKYMLNLTHNRKDLLASSMTTIPHAISRRALEYLNFADLCNPPLAQSKLLAGGFRVERTHYVPVHLLNKKRHSRQKKQFLTDMILGDHLEAIVNYLEEKGPRAGLTDLSRQRYRLDFKKIEATLPAVAEEKAEVELVPSVPIYDVTAVISAHNEERMIYRVVKNAYRAGCSHVVVVNNGSSDDTAKLAAEAGAEVLSFPERLGHDIGRAIGAAHCKSEVYVFLDGDLDISASDIRPFIEAVRDDGVDVALNDLNDLLHSRRVDPVTYAKRFLNVSVQRPDLGANSMIAVPHALSQKAVEVIGVESLGVPPLAMIKACTAELEIQAVHEVDVISKNPIRSHWHRNQQGNLVADLILGDTFEAVYEFLQLEGRRGFFENNTRTYRES